ncbi:MAG: hypothetical protein OER86_14035, partial [Phycisphaerae bacterium]|nr:hypothetical protein [Phycisphaerae bacterium]
MNRPWVSWLIYTLGIGVLVAAVAWASSMAIRLDTKDALAQRDADLDENVRLALWRMDAALGSLIARENARPHYTYNAYFPVQEAVTSKLAAVTWGEVLAPSPLLTYNSPFVKLHFQFDPDGVLSCPQVPDPDVQSVAQIRYDNDAVVSRAAKNLQSLQQIVSPLACAAACPPLDPIVSATEVAALTPQQFTTNPVLQQQIDLPQQAAAVGPQQQGVLHPPAQATAGQQVRQTKQSGRGRISREQQELRNSAEWAMRQKMNLNSAYLSKLGSQAP